MTRCVAAGSVATGFVATGFVATGWVAGGRGTDSFVAEGGAATAGGVVDGVAWGSVVAGFVAAGCVAGACRAGSWVATGVPAAESVGEGSVGAVVVVVADGTVALVGAPAEFPPPASGVTPMSTGVAWLASARRWPARRGW